MAQHPNKQKPYISVIHIGWDDINFGNSKDKNEKQSAEGFISVGKTYANHGNEVFISIFGKANIRLSTTIRRTNAEWHVLCL